MAEGGEMNRETKAKLNRIAVACDRIHTASDLITMDEELWLQQVINLLDVHRLEGFADKKHAQYIQTKGTDFEKLVAQRRAALKGGEQV